MSWNELNALIMDWAASILNELHDGFQSETIIHRMMECGVIVSSGSIATPNYRNSPKLAKLNILIDQLPTEDKNMMVMKRILGLSYAEIGKEREKSKTWAFEELKGIENNLRLHF